MNTLDNRCSRERRLDVKDENQRRAQYQISGSTELLRQLQEKFASLARGTDIFCPSESEIALLGEETRQINEAIRVCIATVGEVHKKRRTRKMQNG